MTFEERQDINAQISESKQRFAEDQQYIKELSEQFQRDIEQFFAVQRESKENDLRRQAKMAEVSAQIAQVSVQIAEVSARIQGRIAQFPEDIQALIKRSEGLVMNAETHDPNQEDI